MNERDDRGLHSAFSISWREGRGRYLRSRLVLPLPAPPPSPQSPSVVFDQYWGSPGILERKTGRYYWRTLQGKRH